MGQRIQDMRLHGQPIEAGKTYKVAGWAPVAEASRNAGPAVWDVVETWFRSHRTVAPPRLNTPALPGMAGNPGLA
jgi:sulfur-oxidizing protein SoxB